MNERSMMLTRPWRRPQYLSSVPYLPGLDGMRALAVVIVMIYHANPSWLHGGFLGVEVFFVISGYLITLLLMAETERTGRIDLPAFWGRRFRRLLPALFTLLFFTISYTALFRADRLTEIRGGIVAALLYVANWWQIWIGADYAGADRFAPLNHLWSLAVEEQFYLIWPVVMLLLLRRGSRRLASVAPWLFGIALLITVANSVLIYTGPVTNCEITPDAYWVFRGRCYNIPNTLYLSTISRAGGLMIGSGFAMMWRPVAIMRGPLKEASRSLDVLGLLGIVAIGALSWFVYFMSPEGADGWLFRGGFLATDIATLVVIASVTHRYTMMGRLLGNPVFVWIGQRSYGLYLYHWLIFQIIRRVTMPMTVVQFAIGMVATVIVTELSYRIIETPVRKQEVGAWWARVRRQSDQIPRYAVTAVAFVAVALLSFSTYRTVVAQPPADDLAASLEAGEEGALSFDDVLDPESTAVAGALPPTGTTVAPQGSAQVPTTSVQDSTPTTTATTVAPSTTAALPDGKLPKLAVGDSVMLGAQQYLESQGWTVVAAQNRQMADAVPFFEQLNEQGRLAAPIIVHLGTNGAITEETLDALLKPLSESNVNLVLIYNVHANRPYTATNNQILADRDVPGDNIILVDWNNLANQCPGDCFYDDGIHLKPDGQKYYEKIATDIWLGRN